MREEGLEPLSTRAVVANAIATGRTLGWHPSLRRRIRKHRTGTRVFFRKGP